MSSVGDVHEPVAGRRGKICEGDKTVVAGVCLQAARQFGVDPVVLRIVAIVLTLSGLAGFTVPLYIAGAFVYGRSAHLPSPGSLRLPTTGAIALPNVSRATIGWVLIGVGAFVAVRQLDWIPTVLLAGIAAVVVGINIVLRHSDRED